VLKKPERVERKYWRSVNILILNFLQSFFEEKRISAIEVEKHTK
jgi:hypothetical protein